MSERRPGDWLVWLELRPDGGLSGLSSSVMETAIRLIGGAKVAAAMLSEGGVLPDPGLFRGLAKVLIYQEAPAEGAKPSALLKSDASAAALLDAARRATPAVILIGSDEIGREMAPRAAAALNAGLTADCTGLALAGGDLIQTRPAFGGDVIARIVSTGPGPQMATIRSHLDLFMESETDSEAIDQADGADSSDGEPPVQTSKAKGAPRLGDDRLAEAAASPPPKLAILPAPPQDKRIEVLSRTPTTPDLGLETAKVVVAAGLGLGGPDGVEKAAKLAEKLGAELGATRAAVERGWLPPDRQIGLSGRHVAPKLLITLGVSGSTQFLAGVKGAEKILAVNIDEAAPILGIADTALKMDLADLWPALEAEIAETPES